MYYGQYKSGFSSEDMSYIKTAFEMYPFGIRQMMEMILLNGGEFIRSLLI